ncbi:hypothetical protein ACFU7Z_29045 [Kitasatospora sp. NPDC057518]
MRSTPRRIARLLVAYGGAAFQVLVLGRQDGPGPAPSRKPPSPGAGS